MKKFIGHLARCISILMLVLCLSVLAVNAADDGASATDGGAISTAEEFANMNSTGSYYLTADITINETYKDKFNGTFDGNGHTVRVSVPMFDQFNGIVKNLTIEGTVSDSNDSSSVTYLGALANRSNKFTAENIVNNASVTVEKKTKAIYAGGLVGNCTSANMYNCQNNGAVSATSSGGTSHVGGMVGRVANSLECKYCDNTASIKAIGSASKAGGIAGSACNASGSNNGCNIQYCTNTGTIDATDGWDAGGMVGYIGRTSVHVNSPYTVKYCTVNAEIKGGYRVGGFVGYVYAYAADDTKGTAHIKLSDSIFIGNVTVTGKKSKNNEGEDVVYGHASLFVGYSNSDINSIERCLGKGELSGQSREIMGCSAANVIDMPIKDVYICDNATVEYYTYAQDDANEKNRIVLGEVLGDKVFLCTEDDIKNGTILWLLNSAAGEVAFVQDIGTDDYPKINTGDHTPIPQINVRKNVQYAEYINLIFQMSLSDSSKSLPDRTDYGMIFLTEKPTSASCFNIKSGDEAISGEKIIKSGSDEISGNPGIFAYPVRAKQLTDIIYVRAYAVIDGICYYSETIPYSVVQYVENQLVKDKYANPTTDEDRFSAELLRNLLEYGTSAQQRFKYNTDNLANKLLQDSVGLEFLSNDDGTCYVAGIGSCTDAIVNIPKVSPTGEKVVSIGERAFLDCLTVRSIVIPDTVTSIGGYAFDGCIALESVVIPNSVKGIEMYAFSGQTALKSVVIPDGVTYIDHYAFLDCSALTSVVIPDSVGWIGVGAFENCDKLTQITIPIEVSYIGEGAFSGCSSLTSITVEEGNKYYYVESNCLIKRDTQNNNEIILVAGFPGITSITIPDTVTIIGDEAFRGCTWLRSIKISENVETIGRLAFSGCSELTEITIPNKVITVNADAFEYCTKLASVKLSENLKSIGDNAFYGCKALTSIVIPEGVTTIGMWAFYDCSELASVTLPENLESIGRSAFGYCSELTEITIPNKVTAINEWAFGYCTKLSNVKLSDNLESIGAYAFYGCTALKGITIPSTVTDIGKYAFWNTGVTSQSITFGGETKPTLKDCAYAGYFDTVEKTESADVRVMTFNLWSTTKYKNNIIESIFDYMPDVIGLQEAPKSVYTALPISDYYSVNCQYHSGEYTGYNRTPILYNNTKYKVVDSVEGAVAASGVEFLNDRYTGTYTKSLSWVVLEGIPGTEAEGQKFIVVNMHGAIWTNDYPVPNGETYDTMREKAITWRVNNVKQMLAKIDALRAVYGDLPVFTTGDYNFNSEEEAYKTMTGTLASAEEIDVADKGGSHHSKIEEAPATNGLPIDHIFYDGDKATALCFKIGKTIVDLNASDHCPVYVDFRFATAAEGETPTT